MPICTTTQDPGPQLSVPPTTSVSAESHWNAHELMEMKQTAQAVPVVIKDVLLLVRIATQMVIYAVILLLQYAVNKMVLQPTLLLVSVGQLNVLLLVLIALNLPIPVHSKSQIEEKTAVLDKLRIDIEREQSSSENEEYWDI